MSVQFQPCPMLQQMDNTRPWRLFVNDKPSGGLGPGLVYCLVSKGYILKTHFSHPPKPLCKFHSVKSAILVENEGNKSIFVSMVGFIGSCVSLSSGLSPKYLCRTLLPPSIALIKEPNS